jgi:hypothetical protein
MSVWGHSFSLAFEKGRGDSAVDEKKDVEDYTGLFL